MGLNKSLDNVVNVIAALLQDVQTNCKGITPRETRLTIQKIEKRVSLEGVEFLTKNLPRLGRALDRALTGEVSLDCPGFRKESGTQLPMLLGGLFKRVFTRDGWVLPNPCISSIKALRQILFIFYKYELPCDPKLDDKVISAFLKAEDDLNCTLNPIGGPDYVQRVRTLIFRSLSALDVYDISPKHGPGAVSTREQLSSKFRWSRYNSRIAEVYPYDQYFYCSLTHFCDELESFRALTPIESKARVILVPKDSRGPRLISCEPLENQWIQQGLMRALVRCIEKSPLTRDSVHFTDQGPNQRAALRGSVDGSLVTLDLKEASDRVSMDLVQLLWPEHITKALAAVRSQATVLPNGDVISLRKHAPMGSALCFPVMALTIWAIIAAGITDADARKSILVYGDDVIVQKAYASYAIERLESFGLVINRDKSCTSGLFRESCGTDAFAGVNVTPVRIRTVWSSRPSAGVLSSWVSYANSFWRAGYRHVAQLIADQLEAIYGFIPDDGDQCGYPSFVFDPLYASKPRIRPNVHLQKMDKLVWVCTPKKVISSNSGWERLLRFMSESSSNPNRLDNPDLESYRCKRGTFDPLGFLSSNTKQPIQTGMYTVRNSNILRRRWV